MVTLAKTLQDKRLDEQKKLSQIQKMRASPEPILDVRMVALWEKASRERKQRDFGKEDTGSHRGNEKMNPINPTFALCAILKSLLD